VIETMSSPTIAAEFTRASESFVCVRGVRMGKNELLVAAGDPLPAAADNPHRRTQ
jgi:hypothetical protein